tara:strand:- start:213 stop:653 length:441 start_codon:yes stop_codon:yes gene_type:complete
VLKGTSINPHAHKSTAYRRTCIHRWALKEAMFRDIMIITSQNDEETYDDLGSVAEISKPELKRPSLYRVILLNDDYTPMEFVIEVLKIFFGMDAEKATQVMLKVHTEGKGVCGVYTRDIAESKAAQVNDFSKSSQQPLLCEIEVDG